VSTAVAVIIGFVLAAATIAGVAKSVTDHGHHSTGSPAASVKLYGSR
jgi:hypothetical protein